MVQKWGLLLDFLPGLPRAVAHMVFVTGRKE
jgi:hypothetical protein